MKISLSKKGDARGKHLVVVANSAEYAQADVVIPRHILKGRRPVREVIWTEKSYTPSGPRHRRIEGVLYRLHRDYLDLLTMTFPHVELSAAAERLLRSRTRDAYADAEVPDIKVPAMKGKLWGFQKSGVDLICRIIDGSDQFAQTRGGFLNDSMGLGKTVQVLAAISLYDLTDVLVITTNNGKWAWSSIAEQLFPSLDVVICDGTAAERRAIVEAGHQITLVNPEMLRATAKGRGESRTYTPRNPFLFERDWEFVVADESHKFKNPSAQQTMGFTQLPAGRILAMSGTPFLNRPEELWPLFHLLAPDQWPGSYDAFVKDLVIKGDDGKPFAYNPELGGQIKDFLDNHGLRRRKDQVVKDLPEVIYSTINVELTPAQRKLYEKIRDEMILLLEDGEISTIKALIAQITRLKQACFSPELYGGEHTSAKIDELKEVVSELVASGHKAIIFSQWAKATRVIQRELAEYNPAYVDGSVKGSLRQAEQDRFNTDSDCHLYVGTIRANQESITLSEATYVIFCDKDWTPMANAQAEARSASGGLRGIHLEQGAKVNIITLYAHGTIEEAIDKLLATKQAAFNSFIERDGGPTVVRQLISDIREIVEAG